MALLVVTVLLLFRLHVDEATTLSADEIMRRVAINQDREQKARAEFVYDHKLHRTERRKDGKLLREEFWTYAISPTPRGTEKKLISVKGRYWKKGAYIPFEGEPVPDSGLIGIVLDDDTDDQTRDGIDRELFPLTSDQQKNYAFQSEGEQIVQGRAAYKIRFTPAKVGGYGWAGEALIDKEEFQPLSIYTQLSRKLPLAVRTMLGTNVPGLGYNIQYTRVDKDLWFPSTYGTEFGLQALFFLNRTFTESSENTNFHRTNVQSQVQYASHDQ